MKQNANRKRGRGKIEVIPVTLDEKGEVVCDKSNKTEDTTTDITFSDF